MKKYILHWWVYPMLVVCVCSMFIIILLFLFDDFDLLGLLYFLSLWGFGFLLFIGYETIAFYLSNLRLQSHLQKSHRLPVFSATVWFALINMLVPLLLWLWIVYGIKVSNNPAESLDGLGEQLLLIVDAVMSVIALILYVLQAKRIARDYTTTIS
jgi:hypothetical protein